MLFESKVELVDLAFPFEQLKFSPGPRAGGYSIVGYGDEIQDPTTDFISNGINFVGDLVGLMVLTVQGKVRPCTSIHEVEDFQKAIDGLSAGKVRVPAILVL